MKKIFLVFITLTFVLAGVFAQDDEWGDDASWGGEDASASTSSGSSTGGFWDKFKISGDANLGVRYYVAEDNGLDTPVKVLPSFELGLDYEGDATNFNAQINLSERTIMFNKKDILDEFHADVFLGDFVLSVGKMKVVWGKGDKLHVLDNFNANDYTDFLIPDYLDRRTGEYMLRVQYNAPKVFRFEAIYTPIMHSDVYASSGCWVPARVGTLTGIATEAGGTNVGLALAAKDAAFATLLEKKADAEAKGEVFYAAKADAEAKGEDFANKKAAAEEAGKTFAILQAQGTDPAAILAAGAAALEAKTAAETAGAVALEAKTAAEEASEIALAAKDEALSAKDSYQVAIENYLLILNSASSMSADDLYPDTKKFEYGQFGFYGNFGVGPVDIGVSYYNGRYKQVTVDLENYLTSVKKSAVSQAMGGSALPLAMPELKYDKLQVFGLDAQAAAGPFTLRAELAYNLTKDIDGDDPWTRNNSISYLFGFDVGIPLHNLNLNVQATGNFVLKNGEIEDGIYKLYDADYDPTGCYSNNKIVVQLKDTFNYEKGEVLVKAIYGFERKDLILMPELSYKVRDGWKISATGLFIHNFRDDESDSEFDGWLDNSFVQLKARYTF